MIATLVDIKLNTTKLMGGKHYTGVEVTYQGQPYKGQPKPPTTRFLFNTNPVAQALENFRVGDVVDISFDTDKWKTPLAIQKQAAPAPAPKAAPVSGGSYRQTDDVTAKRIARSVALKEATIIVLSMAAKEVFTKKNMSSHEFLAHTIMDTARLFEPFLMNEELPEGVDHPAFDGGDMEQNPFDE